MTSVLLLIAIYSGIFLATSSSWNLNKPGRLVGSALISGTLLVTQSAISPPAIAIDVSSVKTLNDEVNKIKAVQDALDARDIPFEDLPSGVSYREFRVGKGEKRVGPGSEVQVEMTLRCKKLSTQKEPGGVMFFSTGKDTPNGIMSWTVGDGTMIPGVDEAMMADGGMKRSSLRRIEIPSTQIFQARRNNQLPVQKDADELRLTKNLWKTEATMIAEVRVMKIIDPPASVAEVVLGGGTGPSF
jgi:hypothetical protein